MANIRPQAQDDDDAQVLDRISYVGRRLDANEVNLDVEGVCCFPSTVIPRHLMPENFTNYAAKERRNERNNPLPKTKPLPIAIKKLKEYVVIIHFGFQLTHHLLEPKKLTTVLHSVSDMNVFTLQDEHTTLRPLVCV